MSLFRCCVDKGEQSREHHAAAALGSNRVSSQYYSLSPTEIQSAAGSTPAPSGAVSVVLEDDNIYLAEVEAPVNSDFRVTFSAMNRQVRCGYLPLGTSKGIMDKHVWTFSPDEFVLLRKMNRGQLHPVMTVPLTSIHGFYNYGSLNQPHQQWVKTAPGIAGLPSNATYRLIFVEHSDPDDPDKCIVKFFCLYVENFAELRTEAQKRGLRFIDD